MAAATHPGLGSTYLQTYGFSHMLVHIQASLHTAHICNGPEKFLRAEVFFLAGEHIDWPEEEGRRAKNECVVSWTGHSIQVLLDMLLIIQKYYAIIK